MPVTKYSLFIVRLLVICPRFPYPLEKGDKLRIFHQIKLLHENHEVCLVSLTSEEVEPRYVDIIDDITSECHIIRISKAARKRSAFRALITNKPLQSAYYYSAKAKKKVDQIVAEFAPEHIYCQLTRMATYVEDYDIPKTLDYMDAFGVGMERRASVTKGLQKMLYNLEAKRMKRYEAEVYSRFDHHTIISEQDRKYIGDGTLAIHVNPNGIDTSHFFPIEKEEDHDIGFVGNMGYPPNIDAAEYLVNKLELGKQYRVLIAGARPDKRVKQLERKNVTITGWVDDVRAEYARCKIFVAPLWSGTGQQNKILEAMAMGIPCVTTSAVNNAIKAVDREQVLIANDPKSFKAAIQELLNNKDLYHKIKHNGIQLVKESYSWAYNVENLESIFEK